MPRRWLLLVASLVGCSAPIGDTTPLVPLSAHLPGPAPRAAPEPPAVAPPADPPAPPPRVVGPTTASLPSGLHNPMPGGVLAGYEGDTGLDIAGSPRPVFAIAAGTLDYSEQGHTLWTGPRDTANCVRFELDAPIRFRKRTITHVYYAHLSELAFHQAEGDSQRIHVEAGEYLGKSGVARGSPHLHLGMLLDGDVTQYWDTYLLADDVARVLGGFRNGRRLPDDPAASPARIVRSAAD